ncbi:hypothetical protein ACFL2R_02050 [Patescibacteria group bacterium]
MCQIFEEIWQEGIRKENQGKIHNSWFSEVDSMRVELKKVHEALEKKIDDPDVLDILCDARVKFGSVKVGLLIVPREEGY